MRVAFIVGGFPKLSETFILVQATGLIDLGHEVDIYSRRAPAEPTVQPEVQRYQLLSRTRYLDLPGDRLRRAGRAAAALFAVLPRRPRSVLRCVNPRRYRSAYVALNNLIFLHAFMGREYDAILCHFGGNGIDFIGLKEAFPRTRFVTMFHGGDLQLGDEQGPQVFAALKELGDAFLVTTDCYGRATLLRYGFPDEKIITHRLGIPVHRIKFRERNLRKGIIRIISVGRLMPTKGIDLGVRAAVALQEANPGIRVEYCIVGDGPLRDHLAAVVRDLGADRIVRMLGALPSPEVMQWMDESDIYLLPSFMEGGGVVLLEAQASGLPVVASRVGGVPEMVGEGRSAILTPAGDVRGFTDALQCLVDRPALWSSMGREGRRFVEERHDIDRLNVRLAGILRGDR